MTEEQLKKIQDELMGGINKEDEAEENLIALAKDISDKLLHTNQAVEEVEGRPMTFKYRTYEQAGKSKVFMTVASHFMYEVGLDKYKPYMVDVEMDNEMSLEENLFAIVEAFLRHVLGMVKAEELNE